MFEIGPQALLIALAVTPVVFVCLFGGLVLVPLARHWIEQWVKRSAQDSVGRLSSGAADLRRIDAATTLTRAAEGQEALRSATRFPR